MGYVLQYVLHDSCMGVVKIQRASTNTLAALLFFLDSSLVHVRGYRPREVAFFPAVIIGDEQLLS